MPSTILANINYWKNEKKTQKLFYLDYNNKKQNFIERETCVVLISEILFI